MREAGAKAQVVPVDVDNRDATVASEVSAPPISIDVAVAVVEVHSGHDNAEGAGACGRRAFFKRSGLSAPVPRGTRDIAQGSNFCKEYKSKTEFLSQMNVVRFLVLNNTVAYLAS